jgi:hypothetical protein
VIGAGLSFIGRKSFALVENSHSFLYKVENNYNMPQCRNPCINVEKYTTYPYTVEIYAQWLGLLQVGFAKAAMGKLTAMA